MSGLCLHLGTATEIGWHLEKTLLGARYWWASRRQLGTRLEQAIAGLLDCCRITGSLFLDYSVRFGFVRGNSTEMTGLLVLLHSMGQ